MLWSAGFAWNYFVLPHDPAALLWGLTSSLARNCPWLRSEFLYSHVQAMGGLLWLSILGLSLGYLLLRALGLQFHNAFEMFGFSLGMGWALLGLLMLVMGLFRLWYAGWLLGGLGLLTPVLAYWARRRWRPPEELLGFRWSLFDIFLAGLLALCIFFNWVGTCIPEISSDALIYHLTLPEAYWRHHGLVPIPHNQYSGFPLLTEMLYGLGLAVGSDRTAHLIHWLCGVNTVLLVIGFGLRFAGSLRVGLLAGLLFYSSPVVGLLSWWAGAELSWTMFESLALYAMALRLSRDVGSTAHTCVAGFFVGTAMGVKYLAWLLLPISAAVLGYVLRRTCGGRNASWVREPILLAGIAMLTAGVWPLKNAVFYGNPIYPFFHEAFRPNEPAPDWRGHVEWVGGNVSAAVAGLEGHASLPRRPAAWWSNPTEPFPIMGATALLGLPFLFLVRFTLPAYRVLLLSLALLWAGWALSTSMARFFVPHIPLASLLYAAAVYESLGGWARRWMNGTCVYLVLIHFLWTLSWVKTYRADEVFCGTLATAVYLRHPPVSSAQTCYETFEFINSRLPLDARILFLGEPRAFRCRRDHIAPTIFDRHPLLSMLERSGGPSELREMFRREAITHVLMKGTGFEAWFPRSPRPSQEREKVFREFAKANLRRLFESSPADPPDNHPSRCALYEVVDIGSDDGGMRGNSGGM